MVQLEGGELGADSAHPGRVLVRLAERIGRHAADRAAGFEAITETAAELLSVPRASIWLYDDDRTGIECVDLYEDGPGRHSSGIFLEAQSYPEYFRALESERIIAAHAAETDPRTREFTESYLRPHGIGAMLDAPIRIDGRMVGVVCHESVGPAREWAPAEEAHAATMGDFVALCIQSAERARAETEHKLMAERLARAHRMEALGRLAGSIAHDFNNMLTAIHGSLELVRHAEKHGRVEPDVLDSELQQIQLAADRAGRLVRQLLSFSRHDSAEPRKINVAEALQGMRQLIGRLFRDNIDLTLETDADTPWAEVDPSQFEQLIVNLTTNARDAMPNGGRLTIRSRASTRKAEGSSKPMWLELLVTDTGDGISPEVLPFIFEPFYSTKMMGTGWGLGLATVQRIVESAGGHIFVRSEPGEGTVFRIRLPAVEGPDDAA
jgi:signal transduction histidine kinase